MQEFAHIAEEAGGPAAPPEASARLRTALGAELARGEAELAQARSGYEAPVAVAFGPEIAAVPVPAALRADPGAASERGWLLTAAAVGALVEAGATGLEAGEWEGRLALVAPGADAELAALVFAEQVEGIDRLRAVGVATSAFFAAEDVRRPINQAFEVALRVAQRGGRPADQDAVEELAEDPAMAPPSPHADPDPALRAARRMLQRLRGMGKWGGYHTEFAHLAKGFPGHERQLALQVGEALLQAGLLSQKPSVGQRHVFLDPRRAADIHALVDEGVTPPNLELP